MGVRVEAGDYLGGYSSGLGETTVAKTWEVAVGTLLELAGPGDPKEPQSSTEHRNGQAFSRLALAGPGPVGRDEVLGPALSPALVPTLTHSDTSVQGRPWLSVS